MQYTKTLLLNYNHVRNWTSFYFISYNRNYILETKNRFQCNTTQYLTLVTEKQGMSSAAIIMQTYNTQFDRK